MIPFKLKPNQKKYRDEQIENQDKIISSTVSRMEAVMKEAVSSIIDYYIKTQMYHEPSLNGMYEVSINFYRNVITEAFFSTKDPKSAHTIKKRLAKPPPDGIPKKIDTLHDIFNTKSWQKIMKRSDKLTERLRNSYIKKLRKSFDEIIPELEKGNVTPNQVKDFMLESWKTSKARVETIFRTETTTYYAKTQVSSYENDSDIIGFLFDSVRDKSRTAWCKSRHGLIYRPGTKLLKQNTPALHWNCRSHLIPLANVEYNRKLLKDTRRDPNHKVVVPLPRGWRKAA